MSQKTKKGTGVDLHVYVKDSNEKISVKDGTLVLREKDSGGDSYKYADIKNGRGIFPQLNHGTYECFFPYLVQTELMSDSLLVSVPWCEISIEPTEKSPEEIDFEFSSNLFVEINSTLDTTSRTRTDAADNSIAFHSTGERIFAQLKNAWEGLSVSSAEPRWKKLPDSNVEYEARFTSPGKYQVDLAINLEPVTFADTEALRLIGSNSENGVSGSISLEGDKLKTLTMGVINSVDIVEQQPIPVTARNFTVSHARRVTEPTEPMSFFVHLLHSSKSIEFSAYQEFINRVLCADPSTENIGAYGAKLTRMKNEAFSFGVGSYELLKTATEIFLLLNGSITLEQGGALKIPLHKNLDLGDYSRVPQGEWAALFSNYLGENRKSYIQHIVDTALPDYSIPDKGKDPRFCTDILIRSRVNNPCFMELIWNYWHEEAMLVQTINAISRRFQNLRAPGERDPLAHVEIDPLRPLNNILWGYVEEERDRLSIKRRAYEYQHQYGLELYGKAVTNLRPADNRSKFLEAFHNLLNKCADYFRAKQDTTVDPDGYPMLHAIQELNLILAHGAHNQFGDLAWTSRVEMLMQEWILARPEIRDFLQSRIMVPHKEAWMPQVDTMKTLQTWSDVPATHFRDLAVMGEQILLTIRWHNWYEVSNEDEAKGWADLMRPYIQSYIHAYRAVTGVDLSATDGVDFTMPSVLLRKRLAMQHAPR
ncbi:MAG TPA: hypothetical protein VL995_05320 [Cellvibrio sp.]|nr:hypothetical protein [Cellvibrio sp.]